MKLMSRSRKGLEKGNAPLPLIIKRDMGFPEVKKEAVKKIAFGYGVAA